MDVRPNADFGIRNAEFKPVQFARGFFHSAFRIPHSALISLVLLALIPRLWVVSHSTMSARDTIGFARYALNLESPTGGRGVLAVIKSEPHPPGYPLAVLAVSWPVRALAGETTCDNMMRSAQLANALAAVLLTIPMFLLGRRLFDARVAWLGTALFAVLPVSVQITSDGLSDGLFLMMATTALLLAVRAFDQPSLMRFALAGAASGFAYLVRPEGLLLAMATGLVIVFGKRTAEGPRWRYVLRHGLALSVGTMLIALPYMLIIGGISNKTTTNGLIDSMGGKDPGPIIHSRPTASGSLPLAVWWNDGVNKGDSRTLWAMKAVLSELLKTTNYVGLPLMLLGLWLTRKRIPGHPGLTLLAVMLVLLGAVLLFLAAKAGYVSSRHTLLFVLIGCLFAAVGVGTIVQHFAPTSRFRPQITIPALLIVFCIPGGLKALHTNREGHRAAGLWLAEHAGAKEQIVDPFRWAEFYAGRSLRQNVPADVHAGNVYAIVEPNSPSPHSRLPMLDKAKYFAERGECVYHWPTDVPVERAKVAVYRAPPLPFPVPADFPR